MSQHTERAYRETSKAWADMMDFKHMHLAIESSWHLRLARKLFPKAMRKRDARVQAEFEAELKKCKKRVAHAARGK